MHPLVGRNIETDVSLTVAQIFMLSVQLTYAGFGIHYVQNVHQKSTSAPASCFYCDCFIGPVTEFWAKTTQFQILCVFTESSRSVRTDFIPFTLLRSKYWQPVCKKHSSTDARVKLSIECSVSLSWLLVHGRMDGGLGVSKWTEWNMLYLHSANSSTVKLRTNGFKKAKWQMEKFYFTIPSAARH